MNFPNGTDNFPNLKEIRATAILGLPKAQFKLGDHYYSKGDFTNATACYRKAAELGTVQAQLSLASCYIDGRGVAQDLVQARKWSSLANSHIGLNITTPSPPPQQNPVPPDAPLILPAPKNDMPATPLPSATELLITANQPLHPLSTNVEPPIKPTPPSTTLTHHEPQVPPKPTPSSKRASLLHPIPRIKR